MADEQIADEQQDNPAATEGANQPGRFEIQKVYVKNVSLETPNTPQVFKEQWKPSVHMDIANSVNELGEQFYEVTLSVTVTASSDEKTIYLVEVQQSGIFLIAAFPKEIADRIVATLCPGILFPFAREAVADLVTRAGFPQLLLTPINFDALYAQRQKKVADEQARQH